MNLKDLDSLQNDKGNGKQQHKTAEDILREMENKRIIVKDRICIDGDYMPEGISLD